MIPAVAIAFALVGGLLLWFVIGSKGPWPLKLLAIVVTTAFTFVLWDALGSFSGWPTHSRPPERAMLVASSVDEPNAIYVWVIAPTGHGPFAYRPDTGEPRAFRLPYTRQLHEEIEKAAQMTAKGQQVEIRQTGRQGQSGSGRRMSRTFRVYRLPPPAPPRKNTLSVAGASTTGSG